MNHKIAILSDIHGNATALEAVIADAKNQGVSEYWLLGDIFLPGPGANDLVALLKDLPITTSVRGNWDDRVLEALDGEYGLEHPKEIQSMRMTQFLMEQMILQRLSGYEACLCWKRKKLTDCAFLSLIICQIRTMVVTC
ncbi:Ser/Thr protein phosphatase family protein [Streptococcus pneumoniae]|nr:Ser/Thr protein phosphatase family protein [Streptococcus pneumoniae]